MSWEESSVNQHTCPCGKGTYTVRLFSDDWGRYKSSWTMDCPSCKNQYELHTFDYFDSGLIETGYRWIKKETYQKAKQLETNAETLNQNAIELARTRFHEEWMSHFRGKKKKIIWAELTCNGEKYPSLGTFYKHTKDRGIDSYLSEFFSKDHIQDIFRILNSSDDEILNMLDEATKTAAEAKRLLMGR